MKVTYTNYVPDPALRGKTVHLQAHVAQVVIALGCAVGYCNSKPRSLASRDYLNILVGRWPLDGVRPEKQDAMEHCKACLNLTETEILEKTEGGHNKFSANVGAALTYYGKKE